jgi:hypothetical protein
VSTLKIFDVFPAVHLHTVRKTDSKKRTITITELCAPKVLEILSDGANINGEKPARLRFDCHLSLSTAPEDVPAIAIKGILDAEDRFSPAPAYLAKILAQETSLVSAPNAYHMAVEILRRAPGDIAIIWYGHGGAIWSAEHDARTYRKLADIEAAVTIILNTPLEVREH